MMTDESTPASVFAAASESNSPLSGCRLWLPSGQQDVFPDSCLAAAIVGTMI